MGYVSQREFAKHIGRSHVWVNRLVKEGRLPSNSKGQIPLEEGLQAYEASKHPGYDANREHGEKQRAAVKKKASKKKAAVEPVPVAETEPEISATPTGMTVAKVNEAYNRARLAEKTYQAKLRELEYKEASGELIPRIDVEADAAKTGAEVRERLMSVGARVAGLCEGKEPREIERIIDEAINEALEALQRSRFRSDNSMG